MSNPETHVTTPIHPAWRLFWAGVLLIGLLGWLLSFALEPRAGVWLGLLIAFLYFTPMAGGMVIWVATVQVSKGRWAGSFERLAASGLVLALPSLIALAALWIASPVWAPWFQRDLPQGIWLAPNFLFARDLAALALFWGLCVLYIARRRRCAGSVLAPWLILAYALIFSLIGFDLVMALDPLWKSSLFGGYFFISGLFAAAAAWTFLSAWSGEAGPDRLQDMAKLTLALSMLTGYLMYSQLLPLWYENIPAETRFLIPRMNTQPGRGVSFLLLTLVYLGPLLFLLTLRVKRSRPLLMLATGAILAGLWIERWWLVAFTIGHKNLPGLPEFAAVAFFAGAMGLGCSFFLDYFPLFVHEERM